MKKLMITISLAAVILAAAAQQGMKFEKMVFINDSAQKCPAGHVWQVQSVLNSNASLKEGFGSSFLSGMNGGQSEADALMKNDLKKTQIMIEKAWFYPSNYPFCVDSGTVLSSGNKARYLIVASYKTE